MKPVIPGTDIWLQKLEFVNIDACPVAAVQLSAQLAPAATRHLEVRVVSMASCEPRELIRMAHAPIEPAAPRGVQLDHEHREGAIRKHPFEADVLPARVQVDLDEIKTSTVEMLAPDRVDAQRPYAIRGPLFAGVPSESRSFIEFVWIRGGRQRA